VNYAEVEEWVRAHLPPVPARVLEVGAGEGELAAALASSGYDVTAIDPVSEWPDVQPVALADFTADEPFDAAVAVVSLHHLEPLDASLERLAELMRPGARLLVDEVDFDALDERAAEWWLHKLGDDDRETPVELIETMRGHMHSLAAVRAALEPWFELSEPVRGTYLYRWKLGEEYRAEEERLVAGGELPRVGARFTATRRPQ
jgi:SAM-dependent methyltransferase